MYEHIWACNEQFLNHNSIEQKYDKKIVIYLVFFFRNTYIEVNK